MLCTNGFGRTGWAGLWAFGDLHGRSIGFGRTGWASALGLRRFVVGDVMALVAPAGPGFGPSALRSKRSGGFDCIVIGFDVTPNGFGFGFDEFVSRWVVTLIWVRLVIF